MAYDPVLKEVVLFGGITPANSPLGDTWVFSSGHWQNITSELATAPAARFEAGLVYDPSLSALVLYGGRPAYGASAFNDTWQFSGSGWSELHPATSPEPRGTQQIVYDSTDGYILLWGQVAASSPQNYWEFQGGTWTNITTQVSGSLPPLDFDGANDPAGGNVVVYGGTSACTGGLGLTYAYAGGVWRNETATVGVPPSAEDGSQTNTYDPASGGVLYFSGYTAACELTNETWVFHGGAWVNVTSEVGPPAPGRWDARLAYDPAFGGDITFGGNENLIGGTNEFGNDTWEYRVPIDPNGTASPEQGAAPMTVNFASVPSGGAAPYRFNWSFDDGSPNATVANVAHTFHLGGNYTVTLTVEDAVGYTAQEQFAIEVSPSGTLAFTQTGLPGGTSWSVTVGTTVWTSTNGGVAEPVSPGSYSYSVGTVSGYAPVPASGMATVSPGEVTSVAIAFAPTNGWIAGVVTPSSAIVLIDGTTVSVKAGAFNVSLPGGLHSVEVTASGYAASYNNVTVTGGKTTTVTIVLQSLVTTPSTTTGLSTTDVYAIVGAIIVLAVSVVVAAVIIRRGRERNPPVTSVPRPPSG